MVGFPRIKVAGFDFRGAEPFVPVVKIARSGRLKLRDSSIGPAGDDGLVLDETMKVEISNVSIHDTDHSCAVLEGRSEKAELRKSRLRDCGWTGVFVADDAGGGSPLSVAHDADGSLRLLVDLNDDGDFSDVDEDGQLLPGAAGQIHLAVGVNDDGRMVPASETGLVGPAP